jgi:hypothetical protein
MTVWKEYGSDSWTWGRGIDGYCRSACGRGRELEDLQCNAGRLQSWSLPEYDGKKALFANVIQPLMSR